MGPKQVCGHDPTEWGKVNTLEGSAAMHRGFNMLEDLVRFSKGK